MENNTRQTTYTSKIGDTTLIIKSSYTGTKTLADAFEDIIVSAYRRRHSDENQIMPVARQVQPVNI